MTTNSSAVEAFFLIPIMKFICSISKSLICLFCLFINFIVQIFPPAVPEMSNCFMFYTL